MLYGDTGRYPLHITIKVRMAKFWLALKSGKNSKLSFRYLNAINNLNIPCKWNAYIKSIIDELGFSIYWNNAETVNHKYLYKSIEQTLKDQFCQSWESSLQNSSKVLNYNMLKENFEHEFFLKHLPRSLSYCLLKFRTANLHFPIETGRYIQLDRHLRKCNYCRMDIGDEYHYLTSCTYISNIRQKYLPKYFLERPNVIKYMCLIKLKYVKLLTKLAFFLVKYLILNVN